MSEIFISQGGQSMGPLTISEVESRLRSGALTARTPAIVRGSTAGWATVREIPGLDPLLIPPAGASLLGNVGESASVAMTNLSRADGRVRLIVFGFLTWWGSLALTVILSWILSRSVYFSTTENLLWLSTLWLGPLIAALLRGDAWARRVAAITAAAVLIGMALLPELLTGLAAARPVIALIPAIGEAGLVVALLALLRQ